MTLPGQPTRRARTEADVRLMYFGWGFYDVYAAENLRKLGTIYQAEAGRWIAEDRRSRTRRAYSSRAAAAGLWGCWA